MFVDPLIQNARGLAEVVSGLLSRLEARGVAEIPQIPGPRGIQFVRWLYRQWLAGGTLLEGRPIRAEALKMMEHRPWTGNLGEMEADLAAICANLDGVVDVPGLRRALPHLLRTEATIRVVLHPTVQADGKVLGVSRSYPASGLWIAAEEPVGSTEPRLNLGLGVPLLRVTVAGEGCISALVRCRKSLFQWPL